MLIIDVLIFFQILEHFTLSLQMVNHGLGFEQFLLIDVLLIILE